MLGDMGGYHLLIIVIIGIIMPLVALVQIWRDRRRSVVNQVVWTAVVVVIPLFGFIGWLIDYVLGKAVLALGARNARRRTSA